MSRRAHRAAKCGGSGAPADAGRADAAVPIWAGANSAAEVRRSAGDSCSL